MDRNDKIIITGAAGLVGQNLICRLVEQGYSNITALDKHGPNLDILSRMHPQVECIRADLAEEGDWERTFAGASRLLLLQAQITGLEYPVFQRNTVDSTRHVLDAAERHGIPFTVFISSSVLKSVADDNYTRSKRVQEDMMRASALPHCILRPTLMFGWFDPKHLGWLSRFMKKTPVFPIPGNGKYIRQPLYAGDFCRAIIHCMEHAPQGADYDICGEERITYIDMIRDIKRTIGARTLILCIPMGLFRLLMQFYALFSSNPPFVADQLDALTAGDEFTGVDIEKTFGFAPTPWQEAIRETYTHPEYSRIVIARSED